MLAYMFVILTRGRGTKPTSARAERLPDPQVRERMKHDADIKIPSTNGVLSLPKQRRFVLWPATTTPPPHSALFPLVGLIL